MDNVQKIIIQNTTLIIQTSHHTRAHLSNGLLCHREGSTPSCDEAKPPTGQKNSGGAQDIGGIASQVLHSPAQFLLFLYDGANITPRRRNQSTNGNPLFSFHERQFIQLNPKASQLNRGYGFPLQQIIFLKCHLIPINFHQFTTPSYYFYSAAYK